MPGEGFGVTTTIKSIPLQGKQTIGFTVNNQLGRQLRVNAYVELYRDGKELEGIDWIKVLDPKTFDLAPDGSVTVTVDVTVPAALPSDWKAEKTSLQLKLVIRNIDNPDKEFGESVPITLHPQVDPPPPPPQPPNRLWMILAAAGGAVVLLGIVGTIVYLKTCGATPPPLALGEVCVGVEDRQCGNNLVCGPSVGKCVSTQPAIDEACDPAFQNCPTDHACLGEGAGENETFSCKAKPGSLQACTTEIGCAGGLVCGVQRKVCVSATPQLGEPCDVASSACPSKSTCQGTTANAVCKSLPGLLQICSASAPCADASLFCGQTNHLCVLTVPSTGDYCDPSGPNCPADHICQNSSTDNKMHCHRVLDLGGSCDGAYTLCKPNLYCGRTLKQCIKTQPQLGDLCEQQRLVFPTRPILEPILVAPITTSPITTTSPTTTTTTTTPKLTTTTRLGAMKSDKMQALLATMGVCPTNTTCGNTISRCVSPTPALGELCDPTSSTCPSLSTCTLNRLTRSYTCSRLIIKLPLQ